MLASVSAVALVLGIGITVADKVPAFDAAVMTWADSQRHPALDAGFTALTWLGSLAVLLPLALAVAWHQAPRLGWSAASLALIALLTTSALSHVVKLAFDRARPDAYAALVALPADASFPSAHAAQATAVALVLLLQSKLGGRRLTLALAVGALALLVAAVAASRIYLQVHFATDVIAGIALAAGVVLGLRSLPFAKGVAP